MNLDMVISVEKNAKIKDNPYKQILIATDGSITAEKAANVGVKFACQSGAKVYAVYVIDVTSYDSILMDESWTTDTCEELKKKGNDATSYVENKANNCRT